MTAIYLAGAEVDTLTKSLLDNGVKNILYSYFYVMQMKREDAIRRYQEAYPDTKFFLDSGAFTYYTKYQSEPEKLPPYKKYVQRYFQYIEEYGDKYCRVTEPDLDHTLPEIENEMVDEWREQMLERWPSFPITPVWHWWRGPKAWESYLQDPRIQHLAIGRSPGVAGYQRRLIVSAHRAGKTVHGFAQTKINTDLKITPYDTVDSSSWLSGQKFGTTYIFRDGKFTVLSKENGGKEKRNGFKHHLERLGLNWDLIKQDDVAEIRKMNVIAWRDLSVRMEFMRKIHKCGDGTIKQHLGRLHEHERREGSNLFGGIKGAGSETRGILPEHKKTD